MLDILPVELSLSVLSYLPLQTLSSLPALSRQWFDFISANQSTIFRNAAILHGYAHPGTLLLEDALSAHKGSPWDGTTDWKDFCKSGSPVVALNGLFRAPLAPGLLVPLRVTVLIFVGRRSFQLRKNWDGHGRIVARLVTPAGGDVHRIKVDEKFGICITTRMLGGLAVTHLFTGTLLWSLPLVRVRYSIPPPSRSTPQPLNGLLQFYVRSRAHCEYENGYLIFDRLDDNKEVWRLVSDNDDDSAVDGGNDCDVVAAHAPPDEAQRRVSAVAATMHRRYAPRGHFRPWAKLTFPETTHAYRFAYPTLLCANQEHAFLHDVRTGALVQTIDLDLHERVEPVCYVDVNDRHVFVCDPEELHVFARYGDDEAGTAAGAEVLRISRTASVTKVAELVAVHGNPFFAALPLRRDYDVFLPPFVAGALPAPLPSLLLSFHSFLARKSNGGH
jgi:F-box-like